MLVYEIPKGANRRSVRSVSRDQAGRFRVVVAPAVGSDRDEFAGLGPHITDCGFGARGRDHHPALQPPRSLRIRGGWRGQGLGGRVAMNELVACGDDHAPWNLGSG
jgi:hypothetical protein